MQAVEAVLSHAENETATVDNLKALKVLVVGAGGLGCEILKDLALMGFAQIDVIDMDTIDLTNLNRQFLFRQSDIGKPKAVVAAQFVMDRVPGVEIRAHNCAIQNKSDDFYRQFQMVVCGLDSVEARRWINAKIVGLFDASDPTSLRPLIDGGTEGWRGQTRVILPSISACYECSLDMLAKQVTYPLCTIASTPRLPEHCIEWAIVVGWPANFDEQLDNDNPEHVSWVYNTALQRAKVHGITGVTLTLAQGVIKRIIPAIASTNAIIAAACCTEAFKIATSVAPFLDNYMTYSGTDGAYAHPFSLEQRPDCPVSGGESLHLTLPKDAPLQAVVDFLADRASAPSLTVSGRSLYLRQPASLEKATRKNLLLPVGTLFESGSQLAVTDVALPFNILLTVHFS